MTTIIASSFFLAAAHGHRSANADPVVALVGLVGAALSILLWWFSKPQCPGCGARALAYLHHRSDGGADRRYSFNPQRCRECGWSSQQTYATIPLAAIAAPVIPSAEDVVARTLETISNQRSTISRDRVLREGLANTTDEAQRLRLKREAAKIEVTETLAHVASLKTTTARRKNLLRALSACATTTFPTSSSKNRLRCSKGRFES